MKRLILLIAVLALAFSLSGQGLFNRSSGDLAYYYTTAKDSIVSNTVTIPDTTGIAAKQGRVFYQNIRVYVNTITKTDTTAIAVLQGRIKGQWVDIASTTMNATTDDKTWEVKMDDDVLFERFRVYIHTATATDLYQTRWILYNKQ